jgi:hypothetical protein
MSSILISSGLATSPSLQKQLAPLNQVPLISGALHLVESVLFSAGLLTVSTGLVSLAGVLAYARGLAGLTTLLVTGAFGGLFLKEWAQSIGRDGRQRIEKKD